MNSGDTAADMASGAVIRLPVAAHISLRARRDRGAHPRSKALAPVVTMPPLPLTAKLKTEKA
jgi:hypothetical protein